MEAGTLLGKPFATEIGGTSGTGVFVIVGEAIGDTGPAAHICDRAWAECAL